MITDATATRLAAALEHLATAMETHCTPRPNRRQDRSRKVYERREIDQWLNSDTWPDDRDGGQS